MEINKLYDAILYPDLMPKGSTTWHTTIESALQSYSRSLSTAQSMTGISERERLDTIGRCLVNIGNVHEEKSDIGRLRWRMMLAQPQFCHSSFRAHECFLQSLEATQKAHDLEGQLRAYYAIGRLLQSSNDSAVASLQAFSVCGVTFNSSCFIQLILASCSAGRKDW